MKATNEAFSEVAKSAGKVGELVAEIAAASQEQAQGIDQVNKAVAEMDRVVQQVAANAEESASASEEMNAQASQMQVVVEQLVTLVSGRGGKVTLVGKEASDTRPSVSDRSQSPSARPSVVSKAHKSTELALKKRGEVSPEEVIPMEEGEFRDF